MNKTSCALALLTLIVVAGCVPSVHPIYTDDTTVFEPRLLGYWTNKQGNESWRFSRHEEQAYKLVFVDKDGKTLHFICHLAKVEEQLFLDLFPDEDHIPEPFIGIPTHMILRVDQIEPTLEFSTLDPHELGKLLELDPKAVKHETLDDGVLLTASPAELQAFVLRYADREGLFGDCDELYRWIQLDRDQSLWDRMERDVQALDAIETALGARLRVAESYLRRSIVSTRTPYGFKIAKVSKNTPAARAGWRKGDILLTWNGKPLESTAALLMWIKSAAAGTIVPAGISRRKTGISIFSRDPWESIESKIEIGHQGR